MPKPSHSGPWLQRGFLSDFSGRVRREGPASHGRQPVARRTFCWGGWEGGPGPRTLLGANGVGVRRRGRKAAAAPSQPGAGDTKNLGSAYRQATKPPPPPSISRRETPGPGHRRAGGRGRAACGDLRAHEQGLAAGAGWSRGRRAVRALSAPALSRGPGRGIRAPAPPHPPPPRPGPGGLPGSAPSCSGAPHARDLPADLLGEGAALGHGCGGGGGGLGADGRRVAPRSRSFPRGLRQSQLRTREAEAGGPSRERALP